MPGSTAYTNIGTVRLLGEDADNDPSSYCGPPPSDCDITIEKTCLIPQPPVWTGVGSCQKPVSYVSVIWNGPDGVDMVVRGTGETHTNIQNGDAVTFGVAGLGNDVYVDLTGSVVGTSTFHVSCSDDGMNGPEDCGLPEGDGKAQSGYINDWLFAGMSGITCEMPAPPAFPSETTACTFAPETQAQTCDDIKDLTALTMVWNGPSGVNVSTPLNEAFSNVQNGDAITFLANKDVMGNDFVITLSGSVNGQSQFHLSCSDDDMNGAEDCGLPQGDGKKDDVGLINEWLLGGMTGENGVISCPGIPGGGDSTDVVYGIRVTNLNGEPVNAHIVDAKLGIDIMETIPAGSIYETVTDPVNVLPDSNGVFENTVEVTANTLSGATCQASDSVLVKRIEPVIPVSCSDIKDITAVSLIWDGAETVDIVMESGETFLNVLPGNRITFREANTGKDVEMTIYEAGTSNLAGTSVFHVSCSDDNMNGTEDCGAKQGDGKSNDSSKVNDWLLDGMTGEKGSFACGLNNTGVVDPEAGGGPAGGVTGATVADLGDAKKFKWELTNNTSQDVYLTDIYVVWPASQGELRKIKLDGNEFAKDVFDDASPTSLPAEHAFESDPNKRKLKKGDTGKLEIEFTEETLYRDQTDFQVVVTFDNGDVVTFSPAPLAVTAAATLDLSDNKKVKWELTNNTTGDVLITEVSISWPAEHKKLKKMKLAKDFAKGIDDSSPSTTVPADKAFTSNPDDRKLKKGETKKLEIEFDKDVKGRDGSEFTIEVKLSNGDTVTFP
jgi:hypothetical protein